MTRKHFEAIARALREAKGRDDMTSEEMRHYIANVIAMEMRAFNSNFDKARFLNAAGIE